MTINFEGIIPRGYRVGLFLLNPEDQVTGEVDPGKSFEGKIELYVDFDDPVKIPNIQAENKNFEIRLETVEEGKRYNVIGKSLTTLAPGTHSTIVRVFTSAPEQKYLDLVFAVKVKGEVKETAKPKTSTSPVKRTKK